MTDSVREVLDDIALHLWQSYARERGVALETDFGKLAGYAKEHYRGVVLAVVDALKAAGLTITDAQRLAELEAAAVWTEGPPPTEPQNKAWAVHRDGWKDCKIAKRSAGAWWIDGNRYGDHLQFDRHKPAPITPPEGG